MGDNEAGAASPKSPERQIYAAYVPPPSGGSGESLEPTSVATSRRASALLNAENASGVRRLGSIVDGDEHRSAGVVGRSVNSFYFRTLAEVCDERSRPWRAALMAYLDNYVDLDLPDRNFFRLATQDQLKRHAARSRAVLLF